MQQDKISLSTAIYIVMGSMIGSGIYIVSSDIARVVANPMLFLLVWLISGGLSIIGAYCFSQMAKLFPHSGGQYQYIKEAYNSFVAFLYGWSVFLVIQSGAIAAVAVAFSKFLSFLIPWVSSSNILFVLFGFKLTSSDLVSVFSLFLITLINSKGIKYGGFVQSLFTIIKIATLGFIIIYGILFFNNHSIHEFNFNHFFSFDKISLISGKIVFEKYSFVAIISAIGLGLVGPLFSSDAWNNVTFISTEVVDPEKNVSKSLIIGVVGVSVLYFLINLSYLFVLPMLGSPTGQNLVEKGIQYASEDRVGISVMNMMFGNIGSIIMTVLLVISTFGANNGLILSGSRVYKAMAEDGLFFSKMKNLNKWNVPEFSLWVQFIWCSLLCLSGKYSDLLDYIMFVVVIFYIITIFGLFRIKRKYPNDKINNKSILTSILQIVYIVIMAGFALNLILMKPSNTIPGLLIVALGIPIYFIWKRIK
ncbi:MAG: amino acid permease [Candidatus Kapabacteria bacterium]|nr:amino acid permease [Candidatus Kapabacteria bacterium]